MKVAQVYWEVRYTVAPHVIQAWTIFLLVEAAEVYQASLTSRIMAMCFWFQDSNIMHPNPNISKFQNFSCIDWTAVFGSHVSVEYLLTFIGIINDFSCRKIVSNALHKRRWDWASPPNVYDFSPDRCLMMLRYALTTSKGTRNMSPFNHARPSTLAVYFLICPLSLQYPNRAMDICVASA